MLKLKLSKTLATWCKELTHWNSENGCKIQFVAVNPEVPSFLLETMFFKWHFLYKFYLSRYFLHKNWTQDWGRGALNKIYFLSLKKKSQLYNCKDEFCSVRDRSGLVIILVPCSTQRATLHPLSAVLFSAQCYPVSSSPFCPGAPLRWPLSVLLEWHVVCCVEASGSLTCMTRVPVLF